MVDHMVDASKPRSRVDIQDIQAGAGRRRRWSDEVKGRMEAESYAPGAVVSEVARRHGVSPQHLFVRRKVARAGVLSLPADEAPLFVPVVTELRSAGPRREDRKDPAGARKRADKRRADRGALPAHLPRIDVTIAPEDTNCPCCCAPMHVIGEETSKRLDVVPAQFRVTHRPKYACRACTDGVVQAPAVERLIKGGLPTEAMVAYVLVAKYAWHPPLYRQAQMLLAQGIDIKRAVLAFWVGYAAAELHPLWLRLREIILIAGKIAVDETTAPVLDPGRGRTKKGFFWAIARRRGGCRSSVKMAVFTPNP